jgi:RNA polymerase sigma-70 factor, ECF subfamily
MWARDAGTGAERAKVRCITHGREWLEVNHGRHMNSALSFDQTLAAARAGDGRAFEDLYELLSRRVYSFVSVRGASDPEGMVNDVFVKVFVHLGDFVGNEIQFSAWVFRIARNTLMDEARRRQRRVDEAELDGAGEPAAGDVESDAIDHLGNDWVRTQLGVLTPEQRDVVVLRIVSDLTIEAIAEVLGKRIGAVKAIQRRAFRTLARNLEDRTVPR